MLLKSSFMFSLQSSFFFFFKQKTAYEVRISDWSSDVCSSDLDGADVAERHGDVGAGAGRHGKALVGIGETELERQVFRRVAAVVDVDLVQRRRVELEVVRAAVGLMQRHIIGDQRSEERRVGKEGVSTWRSRRSAIH